MRGRKIAGVLSVRSRRGSPILGDQLDGTAGLGYEVRPGPLVGGLYAIAAIQGFAGLLGIAVGPGLFTD